MSRAKKGITSEGNVPTSKEGTVETADHLKDILSMLIRITEDQMKTRKAQAKWSITRIACCKHWSVSTSTCHSKGPEEGRINLAEAWHLYRRGNSRYSVNRKSHPASKAGWGTAGHRPIMRRSGILYQLLSVALATMSWWYACSKTHVARKHEASGIYVCRENTSSKIRRFNERMQQEGP